MSTLSHKSSNNKNASSPDLRGNHPSNLKLKKNKSTKEENFPYVNADLSKRVSMKKDTIEKRLSQVDEDSSAKQVSSFSSDYKNYGVYKNNFNTDLKKDHEDNNSTGDYHLDNQLLPKKKKKTNRQTRPMTAIQYKEVLEKNPSHKGARNNNYFYKDLSFYLKQTNSINNVVAETNELVNEYINRSKI